MKEEVELGLTRSNRMASAQTFRARPVYVTGDQNKARLPAKQNLEPKSVIKSSSRIPSVPLRTKKTAEQDTSAPPRPPPPRPSRAPIQKTLPNSTGSHEYSDRGTEGRRRLPQVPSPREPKPLTRTNVTKHDGIWQLEDEEEKTGHNGVLSPPMKYITPQSTEEMMRNFDPLDVLDSASDHSDSSADTMIMMTTEEEKKNAEKIDHSLKEYKTVKFKEDIPNTNKLKLNMQNAKSVLIKYKGTNGRVPLSNLNGDSNVNETDELSSKVTPLHIRTEHMNGPQNVSTKANGHHGSPNDDSPDDGYGTNSSSGTVSSPFSSSFNSVLTDLENSGNSGVKGPLLPNGAIKPNSVRESWAVKRKQRMIDAEDNSVQEQLRQLTIIEEESPSNSGKVLQNRLTNKDVNILQPDSDQFGNVRNGKNKFKSKLSKSGAEEESRNYQKELRTEKNRNGEAPFVNVSQNEIAHRNRQLYVRENDNDSRRGHTLPARLSRPRLQSEPTNEINAPPPVPLHQNVPSQRHFSSSATDIIYDQVYEPSNNVHRQTSNVHQNTGNAHQQTANVHQSTANVHQSTGNLHQNTGNVHQATTNVYQAAANMHQLAGNMHQASGNVHQYTNGQVNNPGYSNANVRREDPRFFSVSSQDSIESAPLMLKTVADQQVRTPNGSGNIYVSATGEEGCYSLNRSWSSASFQPITEVDESALQVDQEAPRSPLEQMSGELLEKWSDMDRNYRNYYGFEDEFDKMTRTDSKVNYFQEKKLNNLYGHDNYYQPHGYNQPSAAVTGRQESANQVRGRQESTNQARGKASVPTPQHVKSSAPEGQKVHVSGPKNKLFQILPNMFKPSSKKQNTDKASKPKGKSKGAPIVVETMPSESIKDESEELESEVEYVNIGDLPQYCLANLIREENLKKGKCVSVENLVRRPVFASSKDIQKLFSMHDQSFDSINAPGSQRHSFHAMPLSYRHVNREPGDQEDMRPRAQSTSATLRSQTVRHTVDTRTGAIYNRTAALGRHPQVVANSVGNLSSHSNSSNPIVLTSRTRLDSGSSGGDSKLSTLV